MWVGKVMIMSPRTREVTHGHYTYSMGAENEKLELRSPLKLPEKVDSLFGNLESDGPEKSYFEVKGFSMNGSVRRF
jgi:hypothetical protein